VLFFPLIANANNSGERMILLPIKANSYSLFLSSTFRSMLRHNYFAGKNKFVFEKILIFYRYFFHYFLKAPRII